MELYKPPVIHITVSVAEPTTWFYNKKLFALASVWPSVHYDSFYSGSNGGTRVNLSMLSGQQGCDLRFL